MCLCAYIPHNNHDAEAHGLVLLISYLCDPFFIFRLIFIIINLHYNYKFHYSYIIKTDTFIFCTFLILLLENNVNKERT